MRTSLIRRVCVSGLLVTVAAGCSDSPTSPSPRTEALPQIGETANYVLRASAGDTIDGAWQERYHAWATAALGLTPPRKITYNKYTSRAHMQSVVGVGNTNAYADRNTYAIHTIWPIDNHEVVHLFTSVWGSPVALVNEGMAVAFQIDPERDLTPRSFLRWLIDQHGLDRVRALYFGARGVDEAAAGVRASFAGVYGQSLDEIEQEWLAFLTR
jgi:hypothetical protein